jgi:hypothetical protein
LLAAGTGLLEAGTVLAAAAEGFAAVEGFVAVAGGWAARRAAGAGDPPSPKRSSCERPFGPGFAGPFFFAGCDVAKLSPPRSTEAAV